MSPISPVAPPGDSVRRMTEETRRAPFVRVENHGEGPTRVAVLRLDRPKVNAISPELTADLLQCVDALLTDLPGAVVVYGGERIFAAGADIARFGDPAIGRPPRFLGPAVPGLKQAGPPAKLTKLCGRRRRRPPSHPAVQHSSSHRQPILRSRRTHDRLRIDSRILGN